MLINSYARKPFPDLDGLEVGGVTNSTAPFIVDFLLFLFNTAMCALCYSVYPEVTSSTLLPAHPAAQL